MASETAANRQTGVQAMLDYLTDALDALLPFIAVAVALVIATLMCGSVA